MPGWNYCHQQFSKASKHYFYLQLNYILLDLYFLVKIDVTIAWYWLAEIDIECGSKSVKLVFARQKLLPLSYGNPGRSTN